MSVHVQWNLADYNATIKSLILELGMNVSKALAQEAKLFVGYCIQLTPPRGRSALSESYNEQKKQGEAAVASDIHRVFKPVDQLAVVREETRVGIAIRKYMRQGNYGAINTILRDIGADVELLTAVDESIHQELRNSKGRLRKGVTKFVVQAQSIRRLVALKISHVGRAKAGWMKAAIALGTPKIPNWIRRHGGQPGIFDNDLNKKGTPSVTVGNAVPWIQEAGANLHVIEQAIRLRTQALKNRIESAANAVHKKHSAK